MKKYEKPFIKDEEIELEDIMALSGDVDEIDEKDPFDKI